MFLLRKSFTYIFIITVFGAICTYTIVVKAYNNIDEKYATVLAQ